VLGAESAAVVYVHGLWMPGFEGALLRRRLRVQRGFVTYRYGYHSVRDPMPALIAGLRQLIARIDAPQVHLLGHSLGGLVVLRFLQRYAMPQLGRVVFLGTPCAGSSVARRLALWKVGEKMLGPVACEELLQARSSRWDQPRELGIIAGTRPVGLGQLLLTFPDANDGTVAVSETELPGASARLCLPVTHSGMLLSARVAQEAGSFLQHGRFGA
jgi:pimeloyl-ACP methyl ester carboxylesterase